MERNSVDVDEINVYNVRTKFNYLPLFHSKIEFDCVIAIAFNVYTVLKAIMFCSRYRANGEVYDDLKRL